MLPGEDNAIGAGLPERRDESAPSIRREPAFRSRFSILFVAFVFGAIAALSAVGFLFNLTINYPGTDRPVIAVDPLWMVGHVIRATGLALLAYYLWRYQSVLRKALARNAGDAEQFVALHDSAWRIGAVVLATLIAYAVVYVIVGGPRR